MLRKIISAILCVCMVISLSGLSAIQGLAIGGVTSDFLSMVTGVDFENDDTTYYQELSGQITDGSYFSNIYSQSGRSVEYKMVGGHYMETYFDANKIPQYADSNALVFWLKTPAYTGPVDDFANLNVGLATNGSFWKLCQSPTSDMKITYISDADKSVRQIPLKYQVGVFMDAPSNFEGWVVIPLDILSTNAWGTEATSKDFSTAPTFILYDEWTPTNDLNKLLYIDSVGLVKNISAFKLSLGAKSEVNLVIGNDFEDNGECGYYAPAYVSDNSFYNSTYSQKGRSVELSLNGGNQLESYFDSNDYTDSQALVFWLKTPEYDDPYGDLVNLDLGILCAGTRWNLCQSPTSDMKITYISDADKSVQQIPLNLQSSVNMDAPSNFEGWVVVPLDVLSNNCWGTPATTKDLSGVTFAAVKLSLVIGWTPANDINKKIYFDSIGLTKDTNSFISSVLPAINYTFNSFNVSENNFITKVQPGTKASDLTSALAPTQDVVTISYTNILGDSVGEQSNVGTGTTVDVAINGNTTTYDIVIYGDINGDGDIAIGDLAAIKQHLLSINTLYDEAFSAGDIFNNGSISISDLLAVKKHLLGITLISQN